MNTRANISRFAASLRKLAGMFAILFSLAALLPSHADARLLIKADERGPADAASLQIGDEDRQNVPDGIPGHTASQCSCGMSVLPKIAVQAAQLFIRPVRYVMGAAPFVPFGAQAPPSEPPRI